MWAEFLQTFLSSLAVSLGIFTSILGVLLFLAGLGVIVKLFEK